MLLLLINVLIIVVIGAICFWAVDKFARDGRLANLLKILVVLICLAAILQRLLPLLGVSLAICFGKQLAETGFIVTIYDEDLEINVASRHHSYGVHASSANKRPRSDGYRKFLHRSNVGGDNAKESLHRSIRICRAGADYCGAGKRAGSQ